MKSLLFLIPLFGAVALAEEAKCQCPQVKCPGDDAVKLCNCLNFRETKCSEVCPDYVPTYIPCPVSPSGLPAPTPSCTCAVEMCPQVWPQSCYCGNNVKERCYKKCGGPEPAYQSCPPTAAPTPSLITRTVRPPKPSSTTTKKHPAPVPTNPVCGGGRGNYKACEEGWTCIKDPNKSGCGPDCDGYGICVVDKLCGGFAAFDCGDSRQVCVDDPRDDCDPKNGGADCGGLCMYKG